MKVNSKYFSTNPAKALLQPTAEWAHILFTQKQKSQTGKQIPCKYTFSRLIKIKRPISGAHQIFNGFKYFKKV